MPNMKLLTLLAAAVMLPFAAFAELCLGSPFSDHAVLQRDKVIPVWGSGAASGDKLSASLADATGKVIATTKTRANDYGEFTLLFPPQKAGGPYTLLVRDSYGEDCIAKDVMIGEVWLASGQSNMEFRMRQAEPQPEHVDRPLIREFTTTVIQNFGRMKEPQGEWHVATVSERPNFSAVAYFFAEKLYRELGEKIPVGIVHSSLGGSAIESWMPRDTLVETEKGREYVERFERGAADVANWNKVPDGIADTGIPAEAKGWSAATYCETNWLAVTLPNQFGPAFHREPFNGACWFRKTIEIPQRWAGRKLMIRLGQIDKHDQTFLNGKRIGGFGSGFDGRYWNMPRRYIAEAKPGPATLAVRVWSFAFGSGFLGLSDEMFVSPVDDEKDAISLAGTWKGKIERDIGRPKTAGGSLFLPPSCPGGLYHAMIESFLPFALRGFIWYQGCTNAADPYGYREKQAAMVRAWRRAFGGDELPFACVLLAGYGKKSPYVDGPNWGLFRYCQMLTTMDEPNCGYASALDVGNEFDIHPHDKKTVGDRLADWALNEVYGKSEKPAMGPRYRGCRVEPGALRLYFRDAGRGHYDKWTNNYYADQGQALVATNGFYIAGSDKQFVPAVVKAGRRTLTVSSPAVPDPRYVRYAWASFPTAADFANPEGLPASPFTNELDEGDTSPDLAIDGMDLGFRAYFTEVGKSAPTVEVGSEDMRTKRVTRDGDKTTVVWKGSDHAGKDFTVTATIVKTESGRRNWTVEATGAKKGIGALVQFDFPRVTRRIAKDASYFVAHSQGYVCKPDWTVRPVGNQLLASSLQMGRYAAFIEPEGESWYFLQDPHDGEAHSTFTRTDVDAVTFSVINRLVLGRPARLTGAWQPFRGGWFEASRLYREEPFVKDMIRRAKLRGNPKALRDVSLWMWNRGLKADVLPPVLKFQKDSGLPAALDWYWWHAIPYDSGYPNFWPPREGVETFRAGVEEARKAGVFTQVYVNGQAWDMDDPTFKARGGEEEVTRHVDGTFTGIAFNRYDGHRLAYACGDQPKFKAAHLALLKNLHDSKLSGQYLDQLGCALDVSCYATNHHHALGQTPVAGYRRQLAEYRKKFPNWPLCTEEVSEQFLDLVDNLICLTPSAERNDWVAADQQIVPAWAAVYHGCATVFGSYANIDGIPPFDPKWPAKDRWTKEQAWEKLFPDQFAVEFVRGVVWGQQPCVHHCTMKQLTDPRYASDYKLMIDTAKFYHANRDWLYDGEMLAPGVLECANREVKFMRRSIYTKDGEYRESTHSIPMVMHSCWKDAKGKKAAFLVNWSREKARYRLITPDFGILEGELAPRSWKRLER